MTLTEERQLAFLIRFAKKELERLSHDNEAKIGDVTDPGFKELREQLTQFLTQDPGRIYERSRKTWGIVPTLAGDVKRAVNELSFKTLKELHRETKRFLLYALEEIDEVRATVPQTLTASLTLTVSLWFPKRARFLFMQTQSLSDVFLLVLHLLIVRGAEEQLRRCANPKCNEIFVRVRKKKFCSKKCTNAANQRTHRARTAG